jgi:hypothetical protein
MGSIRLGQFEIYWETKYDDDDFGFFAIYLDGLELIRFGAPYQ